MTQPSGWYDDPQDPAALRYWDGILWTGHSVPKTSPTAAASTIGRPDAVPPAPPPGAGPTGPPTIPGPDYTRPPLAYGYGAAPQQAWTHPGPTTADGVPLASWGQRLGARIVDNLLVGFVGGLLAAPWLSTMVAWYVDFVARAVRDAEQGVSTSIDQGAINALVEQVAVPVTLITVGVGVVYETFCLTRWGATLGKRAVGIAVRRVGRPGPLAVGEALRRQVIPQGGNLLGLVRLVGVMMFFLQVIDVLWPLWDPRRQALHDKMADTVVVRARPHR